MEQDHQDVTLGRAVVLTALFGVSLDYLAGVDPRAEAAEDPYDLGYRRGCWDSYLTMQNTLDTIKPPVVT